MGCFQRLRPAHDPRRQMLCPRKGPASGLTRIFHPAKGNTPEGRLLLEVARRGEPFPLRERPTKAYPKQQLGKHAELLGRERAFPSLDVYEILPRGDKAVALI